MSGRNGPADEMARKACAPPSRGDRAVRTRYGTRGCMMGSFRCALAHQRRVSGPPDAACAAFRLRGDMLLVAGVAAGLEVADGPERPPVLPVVELGGDTAELDQLGLLLRAVVGAEGHRARRAVRPPVGHVEVLPLVLARHCGVSLRRYEPPAGHCGTRPDRGRYAGCAAHQHSAGVARAPALAGVSRSPAPAWSPRGPGGCAAPPRACRIAGSRSPRSCR